MEMVLYRHTTGATACIQGIQRLLPKPGHGVTGQDPLSCLGSD
jgi:hypothetical protein